MIINSTSKMLASMGGKAELSGTKLPAEKKNETLSAPQLTPDMEHVLQNSLGALASAYLKNNL